VVLHGSGDRFDVAHTSSYVDADRPFNPVVPAQRSPRELVITPGNASAHHVTHRHGEGDEFHMSRRRRAMGAEGLMAGAQAANTKDNVPVGVRTP
jgi:hypothetical protein